MSRLLKEPLLQFLAAALVLYAVTTWIGPAPEPEDVPATDNIVVDRDALLTYMQFRAQAFDAALFAQRFDALAEAELAQLVADYVREEALYREALALGLDQNDYLIRQRLVEKVQFLLEGLADVVADPDAAMLQAWFDARRQDYRIDAVFDFSHIFFDAQQGGMASARERAMSVLQAPAAISTTAIPGDPFPFLQHYAQRTRDFVANNFGAEFAAQLATLEPSGERWQGPLESRYGQHLVLLRGLVPAREPALAEVRERVLQDYRLEALLRQREAAEARVIEQYDVRLQLP